MMGTIRFLLSALLIAYILYSFQLESKYLTPIHSMDDPCPLPYEG